MLILIPHQKTHLVFSSILTLLCYLHNNVLEEHFPPIIRRLQVILLMFDGFSLILFSCALANKNKVHTIRSFCKTKPHSVLHGGWNA